MMPRKPKPPDAMSGSSHAGAAMTTEVLRRLILHYERLTCRQIVDLAAGV